MPLEKTMNYSSMELKVCEGCGALWVRTGIADGVYCRTCRGRLAEFAVAKGRRARRGKVRGLHPVAGLANSEAMAGGAR
jgi:hypothetical protein